MILGNGLISSGFNKFKNLYDDNNIVILGSGVSNSTLADEDEYGRELNLIYRTINENKGCKFIYFSSILTNISDRRYYKHKKTIENLIISETYDYIIFRIPQVVGNIGNKSNLFNFIVNALNSDEEIMVYNGIDRSILDIDDLVGIVNYCINRVSRDTIHISGVEKISIGDLVKKIANHMHKTPNITFADNTTLNNWGQTNSEIVDEAINYLHIDKFGYTDNIIKKYIK